MAFDCDLLGKLERFEQWLENVAHIQRPRELKIVPSENPSDRFKVVLHISDSDLKDDVEIHPELSEIKKKVQSFISKIQVSRSWIINASLHSDQILVKQLRQRLIELDEDFFNRRKIVPELEGVPGEHGVKQKYLMGFDSNFVLNLWYTLMLTKEPENKWKPYFDILPRRVPIPLFWTNEQLELTKGSNLYEATLQLKLLLDYVYHSILRKLDVSISLEDVYWVYSIYSSRAFPISAPLLEDGDALCAENVDCNASPIQNSGDSLQASLVPFGDMFNHSFQSQVSHIVDHPSHDFIMNINTPALDGVELFNNYGPKSNESLLLSYGFIVDVAMGMENPYSSYWIQLAINEESSQYRTQMALLKHYGLESRYHLKKDGVIPQDMFATMRICIFDEQELYFFFDKDRSQLYKPFSYRSETLLYSTLIQLLCGRLSRIAHVGEYIAGGWSWLVQNKAKLGYIEYMALSYMNEQKEILEKVLETAYSLQGKYFQTAFREASRFDPLLDCYPHQTSHCIPEEWNVRWDQWRKAAYSVARPHQRLDVPFAAVPFEWIICKTNILKTSFGMLIQDAWNVLEEDILMALFILYQRRTKGEKWHSYMSALSSGSEPGEFLYCNSISFANDDIFKGSIGNTPLASEFNDCIDVAEYHYYSVFQSIKHLWDGFCTDDFASEHFYWAYSLIMAEATELNCAQLQNSELALLPLHGAIRYHPKTSHDVVFDQASGNIVVWTSALDGEKWAYSDYGKRMDQLLCDRGQVVSESYQPAIVPFSLPLDDDDDTDKRVDLLEKWNLNHSHYLSLHDRPLKIQAALRILCLDTADLEHFAKSQSNPFDSLSDHYELKVKKMFSSIASEKLDNVLSLQVSQSNSPRFDKLKRELIQKYKDKVIKVLEYNLNEFGSTSNCTNESA